MKDSRPVCISEIRTFQNTRLALSLIFRSKTIDGRGSDGTVVRFVVVGLPFSEPEEKIDMDEQKMGGGAEGEIIR